MKRFGALLATFVLSAIIAGCDSGGIKEGMSTETNVGPVSDSFKEQMKAQAKNMEMKNQKAEAAAKKASAPKEEPK